MIAKKRFGLELFIQQEFVPQDKVDYALQQKRIRGNRHLGYVLVRMKAITYDRLPENLASQLDISLAAISQTGFHQCIKRYRGLKLELVTCSVNKAAVCCGRTDKVTSDSGTPP